MNATPTNFPPPGQQQMAYGVPFDPSAPRPNSFPYQQQQQPQFPPQQHPFPPPQQAYPPRNQPQYFQPPNPHGNLQSPAPNGRPGPLNQPGAFQGMDGQSFSAPPYSQPMIPNGIPSSMPQALPSSFQGTTGISQHSTPTMAAPPQLVGSNTPASQHKQPQQQKPMMPNGAFPGQIPSQNQGQAQGLVPPLSPKSATREKLRVTILLDINSSLLQEIISLQAQGKAGLPGQPSPTNEGSPNPATDPQSSVSGSPIDPSKPGSTGVKQQPSQECADCMRRLQANLSYLAAVADRHKRAAATFPASPAIMTPPPHLQSVRELYKKLNAVFPGALQALAKQNQMAMVQAQAQAHAQAQAQAQAQAMNSMQQGLS